MSVTVKVFLLCILFIITFGCNEKKYTCVDTEISYQGNPLDVSLDSLSLIFIGFKGDIEIIYNNKKLQKYKNNFNGSSYPSGSIKVPRMNKNDSLKVRYLTYETVFPINFNYPRVIIGFDKQDSVFWARYHEDIIIFE